MGRHLKQLKLQNIEITDSLFGAYVKKVEEKIIPHQWKILNDELEDGEPTYCIQNFRIAAGIENGSRRGVVFQDTDLYKWLETVSYCLAGGYGRQYEVLADKAIDLITQAQEEDGYLNTYFSVNAPEKKWTNLVEGHELYTAGHLIEAAVAYYQATGKEKILMTARKNADLICKTFGREEGRNHGYPGHQEIELALIKLYRVTGERQYLDTARYFIEERGKKPSYFEQEIARRGGFEFFPDLGNYDLAYSQSHIEPVKQTQAVGHAVRDMYMCSAMADLAEEGDGEMLQACTRIWDNMVQKRMYITGGIGSSGFRERFTTDYDLPNTTNYSETCASIGLMMFGQRMASVTGNAKYYDEVERALYNTVLAGINMEGDRYFYVNPLEVVPEFCTEHTYMDHVKPIRQKWFSVACCPPNVARTLASLGQYIYAQDEITLYIHQYISSRAETALGENKISLEMESTLLNDGQVTLRTKAQEACIIKCRLPGYAKGVKVTVCGQEWEPKEENGYLIIKIPQGEGEITLSFTIKARFVAADGRVRADAGKAALVKGPLVYCLEEIDNGALLSEVYINPDTEILQTPPVLELAGAVPTLSYEGMRISAELKEPDVLYAEAEYKKEPILLKAVPYCLWNNRGIGEMSVWQKLRL